MLLLRKENWKVNLVKLIKNYGKQLMKKGFKMKKLHIMKISICIGFLLKIDIYFCILSNF